MRGKYKYTGFSVIELLAVIAVMSIMMALALPSLAGFTSTAGRRGAVNMLMNTFEQARVAALQSGSNVYVVMRRNPNFGEPDAFCVVRKRSDALGDAANVSWVQLARWRKLPPRVLFYQAVGSLTATGSSLPADLVASLSGNVPSTELFGVAFNRTGQVSFPSGGALNLFLAEGLRSAGTNAVAQGASLSITERLSFRRYTGRAQLDFTAPPQS